MKHNNTLRALTTLICSLCVAATVSAATFTKEVNYEFDASDFKKLAVHVGAGRIEASGTDTNKIQLNVVLKTKASNEAKANDILDNAEILIDESGDELSLKFKSPRKAKSIFSFRRYSLQAEVTVILPKEYEVKLFTGSGGIDVTNVSGVVVLDTGSGNISGSELSGVIAADTGSGSIKLRNIAGSLDADTGSGSVNADGEIHKFRADTGSGSVRIRTLTDITEKSVADTGSGSVHIELPAQASFALDADVGSGRIDCGFPMEVTYKTKHRLKGNVNGGGVLIVGDTGSGGINIQPIN
ncbi:MAG: DUF4097 domain-containing protein [Puniceicoccaceae bacterium]